MIQSLIWLFCYDIHCSHLSNSCCWSLCSVFFCIYIYFSAVCVLVFACLFHISHWSSSGYKQILNWSFCVWLWWLCNLWLPLWLRPHLPLHLCYHILSFSKGSQILFSIFSMLPLYSCWNLASFNFWSIFICSSGIIIGCPYNKVFGVKTGICMLSSI